MSNSDQHDIQGFFRDKNPDLWRKVEPSIQRISDLARVPHAEEGEDARSQNEEEGVAEDPLLLSFQLISKALMKTKKRRLRETQIIAILSLWIGATANDSIIEAQSESYLVQMNTGEGKSTVIASFAAICARAKKEQVHIVTATSPLARRDCEEWSSFFKELNLECSTCCPPEAGPSGSAASKRVYGAHVIYGDVLSFGGDLLRYHFKRDLNIFGVSSNQILGGESAAGPSLEEAHQLQRVIVDEVDSLLIDENTNSVRLATPMRGAGLLIPLYLAIWRFYCAHKMSSEKSHSDDRQEVGEDTESSMRKFVVKLLDEKALSLPRHLAEFAKEQVDAWVASVSKAGSMKLDEDYTVTTDTLNVEQKSSGVQETDFQLLPVDFHRSGSVQWQSRWSNGLHTFLQIKHQLAPQAESLTSCFLAQETFFRRYQGRLSGLTGTLGSASDQQLLKDLYNTTTVVIPPFKPKRVHLTKKIAFSSAPGWENAVVNDLTESVARGQAVLCIFNTISKVREMRSVLEARIVSSSNNCRLRLYVFGTETAVVEGALEPGDIILATLLAGRGTDFKISPPVLSNGGLHVCLTCVCGTLRAEEQVMGRTGRNGAPGTQSIILLDDNPNSFSGLPEPNHTNTAGESSPEQTLADHLLTARTRREIQGAHAAKLHARRLKAVGKLFSIFSQCTARKRVQLHHSCRGNQPFIAAELEPFEEIWARWLARTESEAQRKHGERPEAICEALENLGINSDFADAIYSSDSSRNPFCDVALASVAMADPSFGVQKTQEALGKSFSVLKEDGWQFFPCYVQFQAELLRVRRSNGRTSTGEALSALGGAIESLAGTIIPAFRSGILLLDFSKREEGRSGTVEHEATNFNTLERLLVQRVTFLDKLLEDSQSVYRELSKTLSISEGGEKRRLHVDVASDLDSQSCRDPDLLVYQGITQELLRARAGRREKDIGGAVIVGIAAAVQGAIGVCCILTPGLESLGASLVLKCYDDFKLSTELYTGKLELKMENYFRSKAVDVAIQLVVYAVQTKIASPSATSSSTTQGTTAGTSPSLTQRAIATVQRVLPSSGSAVLDTMVSTGIKVAVPVALEVAVRNVSKAAAKELAGGLGLQKMLRKSVFEEVMEALTLTKVAEWFAYEAALTSVKGTASLPSTVVTSCRKIAHQSANETRRELSILGKSMEALSAAFSGALGASKSLSQQGGSSVGNVVLSVAANTATSSLSYQTEVKEFIDRFCSKLTEGIQLELCAQVKQKAQMGLLKKRPINTPDSFLSLINCLQDEDQYGLHSLLLFDSRATTSLMLARQLARSKEAPKRGHGTASDDSRSSVTTTALTASFSEGPTLCSARIKELALILVDDIEGGLQRSMRASLLAPASRAMAHAAVEGLVKQFVDPLPLSPRSKAPEETPTESTVHERKEEGKVDASVPDKLGHEKQDAVEQTNSPSPTGDRSRLTNSDSESEISSTNILKSAFQKQIGKAYTSTEKYNDLTGKEGSTRKTMLKRDYSVAGGLIEYTFGKGEGTKQFSYKRVVDRNYLVDFFWDGDLTRTKGRGWDGGVNSGIAILGTRLGAGATFSWPDKSLGLTGVFGDHKGYVKYNFFKGRFYIGELEFGHKTTTQPIPGIKDEFTVKTTVARIKGETILVAAGTAAAVYSSGGVLLPLLEAEAGAAYLGLIEISGGCLARSMVVAVPPAALPVK